MSAPEAALAFRSAFRRCDLFTEAARRLPEVYLFEAQEETARLYSLLEAPDAVAASLSETCAHEASRLRALVGAINALVCILDPNLRNFGQPNLSQPNFAIPIDDFRWVLEELVAWGSELTASRVGGMSCRWENAERLGAK